MVEQLSIEEFERLLSRGRGKAILHLQQHDVASYRDVIRRCCLTNTAYDPQIEGTRERYLMDLIALSGEADAICEVVIQTLLARGGDFHGWDFDRLFALLGQFARKGHKNALQAMYAWCRIHYDPQDSSPGALYPLLKVEGIKAFLFLLDPRQSGRPFDMDSDDYYDFEYFLDTLEGDFGEAETYQAFKVATENEPALQDTISTLYARRNAEKQARELNQNAPHALDRTDAPYVNLRRMMESGELRETGTSYGLSKWGEKASEADLYAAAEDFTTLALSLNRIGQYVGIFQKRRFPLSDFSRFFDLARRTDLVNDPLFAISRIPFMAFRALENISHPQIRAFALELISTRYEAGRAAGLLAKNFESSDWSLIVSLFDADLDDDDYHNLGFSIQKILESHLSLDAVPSLIRLFDANPCSHCRERVVESLVSLNALPDWIAEECRYDANLDLRAYAQRGFTNASDD